MMIYLERHPVAVVCITAMAAVWEGELYLNLNMVAESSFDLPTSGLWAQMESGLTIIQIDWSVGLVKYTKTYCSMCLTRR